MLGIEDAADDLINLVALLAEAAEANNIRGHRRYTMKVEFEISAVIPAVPGKVYAAWLNSAGHSKMTGAPAKVSAVAGGAFQAWEGYIQGKNLELEAGRRILQSWRTAEFQPAEPDSLVEIVFEAAPQGTKVVLRHTNLPPHGTQYEQGWVENYFLPMQDYFKTLGSSRPAEIPMEDNN